MRVTALITMVAGLWLGAVGASAQLVWDGPDTTFTKAGLVDWTLEANQDRLTSNVWLTRTDVQGLFNIAQESAYNGSGTSGPSPVDTEWVVANLNGAPATGVAAANYAALSGYFDTWAMTADRAPPSLVGKAGVLHLITDDIYVDITFSSWEIGADGGRGGFSYTRSTAPVPEPHEYALMAGLGLLGFAAWRRRCPRA